MKNKKRDVPYCGIEMKSYKNAKPILSEPAVYLFHHYVIERYRIHVKKDVQHLSRPWTTDKILLNYKFTNVRREHDTETRWLIRRIATNPKLDYDSKIMNCILFRLFNRKETMILLGAPFDFHKFDPEEHRSLLETYTEANPGESLFTTAFYTSGTKMGMTKYVTEKNTAVRVLLYVKYLWDHDIVGKIKKASNQQEVYRVLKNYNGIGAFLAYQMFVDMTYIPEFPFSENEFTVAGPGCKMGLDFMFIDRVGLSYEACLFWLRDNIEDIFYQRNLEYEPFILFSDLPKEDRYLNVMSLENCFCEFSKYYRAVNGISRPKKRYPGDASHKQKPKTGKEGV